MSFLSRIGQRQAGRALNPRRAILATVAAASLVTLGACTIDTDRSKDDAPATEEAQEKKVGITASVKDGAEGVNPTETVTLTSDKAMSDVSLTDGAGNVIEGKLNKDKTEWRSTGGMEYGSAYTLTATNGETDLNQTFTTIQPNVLTNAYLAPLDGATVGVGQSIALKLDAVPTDRKAVQDAISIKTEPKVEGAFYWISNTEVRWRPENYWKPGTTVTVDAKLRGVDFGDGLYSADDRKAKFTIGDDIRAVVDDAAKTMTVTKNGQTLKTMPTSNGRDNTQWATPNGVYQIGDQYEALTMDSNTFGYSEAEGGYVTDVSYATQMSYSGIYIHAAPWSVWAQGSQNTSHGCINLSMENANWVYQNFKRGDIVTVKNSTGPTLPGYDGLGDWNIDWKTWKAGNADDGPQY